MIYADMWGIDSDLMECTEYMRIIAIKAAELSGATVLDVVVRKFEPQGLTIGIILSESHLNLHFSSELNFINFDMLTCGSVCNPQLALDFIIEILKPTEIHKQLIIRGVR